MDGTVAQKLTGIGWPLVALSIVQDIPIPNSISGESQGVKE